MDTAPTPDNAATPAPAPAAAPASAPSSSQTTPADRLKTPSRPARRKRSTRRRITLIALILVAALIIVVGYTGVRGYALVSPLQRIVELADTLGAHARAGNLTAVASDLKEINTLANDSAAAAADPSMAAASRLPLLGDNVRALRVVAVTAGQISTAAQPLVQVLPTIGAGVVGKDGRIDVAAVTTAASGLTSLTSAIATGSAAISAIDTTGLIGPLANAVTKLDTGLTTAATGLDRLAPVVNALPILLGADGKRDWLVIFQNLAEARGTGGLISAWASLSTDKGSLKLKKVGSNDVLVADNPVPQTGLPKDFTQFWGDDASHWLDMNASAHFPYTGRLVQNGWKKLTGEKLDGVITLGQGIVQTLIAATGTITVRGVAVTGQNAESFLSKDIYAKFPDVKEKDAVVSELIGEVFKRISTGKLDFASMATSAFSSTTTDRMLMWSGLPDDQKKIVAAGVGGIVPTDGGPTAIVSLNNGGGNKLEAYLHTSVDYTLGSCDALDSGDSPARNATLTVTLTNSVPKGLPKYVTPRSDPNFTNSPRAVGSNREYVSVYLPVGAEDNGYFIDGEQTLAAGGFERGRELVLVPIEMAPGQTREFVVKWVEPFTDIETGKPTSATPTVLLSPMLNDPTVTAPVATLCPPEK